MTIFSRFACCVSWIALALVSWGSVGCQQRLHLDPERTEVEKPAPPLRVLAWNILHGGRDDGEKVGPERVIEVIRESGADVVAMQETYGSGELISEALSFHFHPRGTNVSIHSRYPVIEDVSVHQEFQCVGALLETPHGEVAVYSIWLPYSAEIWEAGTRNVGDPDAMRAACHASVESIRAMRAAIDQRLQGERYRGVPVILAGDFNSMSHLDYHDAHRDQFGMVVDWETSRTLIDAGYRDAYRELHPRVRRLADRTWTPRFPEQEQDRIDFVYYRGATIEATAAKIIDRHSAKFPSDHAALLTTFEAKAPASPPFDVKVVSYNIKHGRGMDGKVDLDRAIEVLRAQQPDIVALQEIDEHATRSGGVNQAVELGRALGLHPTFGPFMDFQGGRYGLALLSRYPLRKIDKVLVPKGNEPRIALAVEVRLPNGDPLLVVDLHFDWVKDDAHRFSQASTLCEYLAHVTMPFVILGDFNDSPGSRTLDLFHELAREVPKPKNDRFTFSSTKPEREIDFIFVGPPEAWETGTATVIDEPLASDHRPVVATLRYLGTEISDVRAVKAEGSAPATRGD